MIFGDKRSVAIEISIDRTIDSWVYGRFLMWIGGSQIGSSDDYGTDIKGCVNWLSGFARNPRNRHEPRLAVAPKEEVWRELVDSVFSQSGGSVFPDAFSRFHISYIGMSAFDEYVIVLLDDGVERERCLWRFQEGPIGEFELPLHMIAGVAKQATAWFEQEFVRLE